jgi:hypothetical protein
VEPLIAGENLSLIPGYKLNSEILLLIAATHGKGTEEPEINEFIHQISNYCLKNKKSFAKIEIDREKMAEIYNEMVITKG